MGHHRPAGFKCGATEQQLRGRYPWSTCPHTLVFASNAKVTHHPQPEISTMARLTRTLLISLCCLAPLSLLQAQGSFQTTSLLGRKLYAQTEDESIRAARTNMANDPGSASAVALSTALAGRRQYQQAVKIDTTALATYPSDADLLLERGHRELGLREFAAAQKDLEAAVAADPSQLDSHYHLGLAYYFQGQFDPAALQLERARDLATTDDSLIDCTAWLYVALQRAGKPAEAAQALSSIKPSTRSTEPHLAFYLSLLHFYQGRVTEAKVLPPNPSPGDVEAELAYNTICYGVGNWHLYHGDTAASLPYFRKVVAGDAWNSWGFIGAETDLARQ